MAGRTKNRANNLAKLAKLVQGLSDDELKQILEFAEFRVKKKDNQELTISEFLSRHCGTC